MGLPRSTYYDTPATEADTEIVARITAICEEFEAYGYRRVGAELRHERAANSTAAASTTVHRNNARSQVGSSRTERFTIQSGRCKVS